MSRNKSQKDNFELQEEQGRAALGHKIRELRSQLGMSQIQMAASLGIRQGFLSEIERGLKFPSKTLMTALLYRYKINADWLADPNHPGPIFSSETRAGLEAGNPPVSGKVAAESRERSYDRFRLIFHRACEDLGVPELFHVIERVTGTISAEFKRYKVGLVDDSELYEILSGKILQILERINEEFR
jgi:transcriptional regulator with XRE-family HTH domain